MTPRRGSSPGRAPIASHGPAGRDPVAFRKFPPGAMGRVSPAFQVLTLENREIGWIRFRYQAGWIVTFSGTLDLSAAELLRIGEFLAALESGGPLPQPVLEQAATLPPRQTVPPLPPQNPEGY